MNIVITGASRGIGYETAKLFASDESNLILAVSRNKKMLNKLSDECDKIHHKNLLFTLPFDIEKDKASLLTGEVRNVMKHVDILINNAGLLINKPFLKLTDNDWKKIYEVNVFGVARIIKDLLPLFNKTERNHIVNISSMGGLHGTSKFAGLSAYSSGKGALCTLTECLAEEFKDKNIAVNCLALGAVQTEMLSEAFPGYEAPVSASEMAKYVFNFAKTGQNYFNGKILPVSLSTP